ncbi:hypothetical protein HLB23_35540 [Nocardia uniformis]|uniref:Uncharacterized protein n=1 Tax=Nocardia uniformis TaxID=53432 RepID=A0A849CB87_9NOCA|nr:hypothetical protein [Nocardia uniformis]NNH75106.1 hypothetical protein [Nocardia uniformis]
MTRRTTKVSLSLETSAWEIANREAAKAGISPSAWVSKACQQKAIRDFRPVVTPAADEAATVAYEAEQAAAEADERHRRRKGAA